MERADSPTHRMDEGEDDAHSEGSQESSSAAPHAAGAASATAAGASSAATPALPNPLQIAVIEDPKLRFILELEFVEMLASPHYLHCQSRHEHDRHPRMRGCRSLNRSHS